MVCYDSCKLKELYLPGGNKNNEDDLAKKWVSVKIKLDLTYGSHLAGKNAALPPIGYHQRGKSWELGNQTCKFNLCLGFNDKIKQDDLQNKEDKKRWC